MAAVVVATLAQLLIAASFPDDGAAQSPTEATHGAGDGAETDSVMVIGDSITQGFAYKLGGLERRPHTWRSFAAGQLERKGVAFSMVGPNQGPPPTVGTEDRAQELLRVLRRTTYSLRQAGFEVGFINGGFAINTAVSAAGGHTIDGVHPNAIGDRIIGANVVRGLLRAPIALGTGGTGATGNTER